jgi:hypothetical protein
MSDESWEEQFKQFLRKTGDDFRRAGGDIKAEAQKLFDAAVDPDKQQRVRDRLKELSSWARKTAEDVAGSVETAASKAARALQCATDNVIEATGKFSSPASKPSSPGSPGKEGKGRIATPGGSAYRKGAKARKASGGKIKGKPAERRGKPK